ncbi:MAG: hypothetical protein IPO81_19975 [Kouleothrix sp.]|nr:hypothetical protein [Kouleothrix sp.]
MGNNPNKRLPQATIDADRAGLVALKQLADYAPANPALSVAALCALEERLRKAEEAAILAENQYAAACDAREAAQQELHSAMLGVKATVIGQYGHNSDAVQAIGLKKKTDYRRPGRRRVTSAA